MISPIEETDTLAEVQELLTDVYDLVLYNDDVNTFEYVIESLMEICNHESIQAEQCTWIIHHKGKCSVKKGSVEELEPMIQAFLDRKISAKIES